MKQPLKSRVATESNMTSPMPILNEEMKEPDNDFSDDECDFMEDQQNYTIKNVGEYSNHYRAKIQTTTQLNLALLHNDNENAKVCLP